jgi:flagellar hook protein FlgE
MANSLMTGVSGLMAHKAMLDVVGNNLANMNTSGFKARSVVFSDLVYETLRNATAGVAGQRGGTNPMQIGNGVKVAGTSTNFNQGELRLTGGQLDMAMDGDGFFTMSDGDNTFFTRTGSFALDANGILVDPSTGFRVTRFGTLGEPAPGVIGFQVTGDDSIRVPIGSLIPGQATEEVTLEGNLSPSLQPPTAEELRSDDPWEVGGSPAALTDLLNSLDGVTTPYAAGDDIEITGTDVDGTPISATLAVTATTTIGDLINAINAAYSGATASLDSAGHLVLESDTTGESLATLDLDNATGNAGDFDFAGVNMLVSVTGSDGDVTQHVVDLFDLQGNAHRVVLSFNKEVDGTWTMNATTATGTVVDGLVSGIQMDEDGSFAGVNGTGTGDVALTLQFPGISSSQTLTLDFGQAGGFSGLTQIGGPSSLTSTQDGFAPGNVSDIQVNSDGIIYAVATNGLSFELAQLAIAHFRNPAGLLSQGDNMYASSLNSGPVDIGAGLTGGRGAVVNGQLESSNVEIAEEFTRLIIAQRGFQANSRTITVTDEVLEELNNLIR